MLSDSAEIKPAQCCIKLVFHLTYTMMHGSTKLKFNVTIVIFVYGCSCFNVNVFILVTKIAIGLFRFNLTLLTNVTVVNMVYFVTTFYKIPNT